MKPAACGFSCVKARLKNGLYPSALTPFVVTNSIGIVDTDISLSINGLRFAAASNGGMLSTYCSDALPAFCLEHPALTAPAAPASQ